MDYVVFLYKIMGELFFVSFFWNKKRTRINKHRFFPFYYVKLKFGYLPDRILRKEGLKMFIK